MRYTTANRLAARSGEEAILMEMVHDVQSVGTQKGRVTVVLERHTISKFRHRSRFKHRLIWGS
jgi:hypothetical protein